MTRMTAKDKLLASALDIMVRHGYSSTRVDEVCEKAGVSKGSFYHFFDSKEDLGLAVLHAYFEAGMRAMMDGAWVGVADPAERALAFVDHTESISLSRWSQGCLLGNFAIDLAEIDSRIRDEVRRYFEKLEQGLEEIFAPLSGSGDADGRPTAREIARHFLAVIEGSIVLSRAHGDPGHIPEGLRQFRRYLEPICV